MDTSAGTIMSEDEKDPDVIPQYGWYWAKIYVYLQCPTSSFLLIAFQIAVVINYFQIKPINMLKKTYYFQFIESQVIAENYTRTCGEHYDFIFDNHLFD